MLEDMNVVEIHIIVFDIDESIDTIGLFIIPEGSHYYTDGYFYASDTLKLLRTLPKNKFFNYMMNR